MPLSHAVLFLGAYLVLPADEVPRFDYEATCRALLLPSDQGKGLEQDCHNSQKRARSQLEQQWGHEPDQSPVAQARVAARVDAVEELPGFLGGEGQGLGALDDV